MKKTVLILTDSLSTGGVNTYIKNLHLLLKKNIYQLKIISLSPSDYNDYSPTTVFSFNIKDLSSLFFFPFKILKNNITTYSIAKKIRPVKIIFQSPISTAYLSPFIILNLLQLKIPMVYQFHGSYSLETFDAINRLKKHSGRRFIKKKLSAQIWFMIEISIYYLFPKVICFSTYAREILQQKFRVLNNKIIVVQPPYYNENKINVKKIEKNNFINAKKLNLVFLGRIEPRKGVFELLEVCRLLSKKKISYSLNIITNLQACCYEGHIFNSFFNRYTHLGVSDSIRFFNNTSRKFIAESLSNSDLCLMLSLDLETFGYSCLESLTSGCPVVCLVQSGALAELVRDGENGYVIQSSSEISKSVVIKIEKYLSLSKEEKIKMRKNSVSSIRKYSKSNYVESVILS